MRIAFACELRYNVTINQLNRMFRSSMPYPCDVQLRILDIALHDQRNVQANGNFIRDVLTSLCCNTLHSLTIDMQWYSKWTIRISLPPPLYLFLFVFFSPCVPLPDLLLSWRLLTWAIELIATPLLRSQINIPICISVIGVVRALLEPGSLESCIIAYIWTASTNWTWWDC